MEDWRGQVSLCGTMLDDSQIDTSSYVVVMVDMVHENLKDLKLEVSPDDMTLTMSDVVARRVHLRRTSIDVHRSAVTSTLNNPSQPNIALASIFPETYPSPSPIEEEPRLSPIREEPHPSPI
jgi:hypothetical protein